MGKISKGNNEWKKEHDRQGCLKVMNTVSEVSVGGHKKQTNV